MPNPAAALLVLGQAAGSIQLAVDALRKIPDAVRGFTDAYSPQAGLNLDRAFRSLQSTIGFALEPVVEGATHVIDSFAGAIVGAMDRLRGPLQKIIATLSGALQPAVEAVGAVMDGLASAAEALEPLLPLLGTAVEGLAALFRVGLTVTVEYYLALLKQLIPGTDALKSVTDTLAGLFVNLSEATLRVTHFLLSLVGKGDAMKAILQSLLKEPPRGGRPGAPQGFAISNLEDVYRKRLLAAAQAGGKPIEERTFDVMAGLRDVAQKILDEIKNLPPVPAAAQAAAAGRVALGAGNVAGLEVIFAELFRLLRQNNRNAP